MTITKMRVTTLGLALAAAFVLNGVVFAGEGMAMGNATPAMPSESEKLQADFVAKTAATNKELTSKQFELQAQLYSANPDEKKIQDLISEISALRGSVYAAQVELQRNSIKAGIASEGMGCPMMSGGMGGGMMGGGKMGCGMMGGGKMGGGMMGGGMMGGGMKGGMGMDSKGPGTMGQGMNR